MGASRAAARSRARAFPSRLGGGALGPSRPGLAHHSSWAVLLAGLLAGGLILAGLRIDGIRVRYRLGEAVKVETALKAEHAEWRAAVQRLRDPARLGALAPKLGLARAERVIQLPAGDERP